MLDYAACMDRLVETEPGRDWLARIVADKSHFIHPYVMETASAVETPSSRAMETAMETELRAAIKVATKA